MTLLPPSLCTVGLFHPDGRTRRDTHTMQKMHPHSLVPGYLFRAPAWRLQGCPPVFRSAGAGETSLWQDRCTQGTTRGACRQLPTVGCDVFAGQVASLKQPKVSPNTASPLQSTVIKHAKERWSHTYFSHALVVF